MTDLVHTAIQNLFQQDVSTFADVVQRVGFDWSCIRSHATARPDLWALLVGLLCLSWYLYNYGSSKDQNSTENLTLPAVQALAVVFTPTCGAWPSHLTSHFATARVLTSNRVQVNISDLWEQICCGNIEVRDSRDLSELVGGKMRSYGWRFKLSVDRSLWLQTARWITSHYFEPSQSTAQFRGFNGVHDLDFVPYYDLESEIKRNMRIHKPGSTFAMEFSALAPGTNLLGQTAIMCSLPFQSTFSRKHEIASYRTATPLLVSLQRVVALTSNDGSCAIESVNNVSRQRAEHLYQIEQQLTDDRKARREVVNGEGIYRWREKRLILGWEAGLLTAGLLIRWRILLKK